MDLARFLSACRLVVVTTILLCVFVFEQLSKVLYDHFT